MFSVGVTVNRSAVAALAWFKPQLVHGLSFYTSMPPPPFLSLLGLCLASTDVSNSPAQRIGEREFVTLAIESEIGDKSQR